MRVLLTGLMVLAGVGFALSLTVNLMSVLGKEIPAGSPILLLEMIGLPLVWVPTSLIVMWVTRRERGAISGWRGGLDLSPIWRASPRWMKRGLAVLGAYAAGSMATAFFSPSGSLQTSSAFWMLFQGAALVMLHGIKSDATLLRGRRCPMGHAVALADHFCEACGARIEH